MRREWDEKQKIKQQNNYYYLLWQPLVVVIMYYTYTEEEEKVSVYYPKATCVYSKKIIGSVCRYSKKIVLGSFVSLVSVSAFAENNMATVEGMRRHFINTSSNLMAGVLLVAAVAGLAYLGFGLFSLKAASDSAGQSNQNMQKGFAKIIIGGCLVSLPFLMNVSQSILQTGVGESGIINVPTAKAAQTDGKMHKENY